jgi:hypothetical protein
MKRLRETCDQGVPIYLIKKGELGSLWEMQDVEDSDQTNEGKNEEGRKETSPCRHTTFKQNCAVGNFEKRLKNNLPLVICASKLANQR